MPVEVINNLPPPWPEGVLVSVYNANQEENPPMRFAGEDYAFPPETFESIKPEAAWFLFGAETRLREGYGTKMVIDPEARQRAYLRLGCTDAKGKAWLNNFRLKLVKLGKRGSRENWGKLPALCEL